METALGEWAVIGSGVTTGVSKRNQAEASFFVDLRRKPHFWQARRPVHWLLSSF